MRVAPALSNPAAPTTGDDRRQGPLRTALLTWDLPPAPTGLGRAADAIAHGLSRCGADVTVISLDRDKDEEASYGRIIGAGRFLTPTRQWVRRRAVIGHLAAPSAFAAALRAAGGARNFDVIEATNWYAPAALVREGTAALVIRHSTPAGVVDGPGGALRDQLDMRAATAIEGYAARRADAHISNTRHHAGAIAARYRLSATAPHRVISLGLEEATIAEGREAREPNGSPEYLFVGRPEKRKGFDAVIHAHRILCTEAEASAQELPHLHLVGFAPGDLDTVLAQEGFPAAFRKTMTDHGRAADETLHALLARVHLVLAPSRYESFGLVYREAAAFGRPVVATAEDPSAREFAEISGAALLASSCSGPDVARAARRILTDRDEWSRLSRAGHAHAETLTLERLGAATLELYAAALGALRPGARA